MKKVGVKHKSDDSKIDLTPMLDVVFILLIFFVVTATFLSETAISAASSDNNNDPPPPEQDTEDRNILFEIGPITRSFSTAIRGPSSRPRYDPISTNCAPKIPPPR